MDLFNGTFFRFAFGFIGIIMISVAIIFIVNVIDRSGGEGCTEYCGMGAEMKK